MDMKMIMYMDVMYYISFTLRYSHQGWFLVVYVSIHVLTT